MASPQISIRVSPEFRALVDAVHLQRRESMSDFIREAYMTEARHQIVDVGIDDPACRGESPFTPQDWEAVDACGGSGSVGGTAETLKIIHRVRKERAVGGQ